jgi:hypothetical protein
LAAYRAGERIRDERTSEVYDHTERHDIVHNEIVLPSLLAGRTDTNWARDRSTRWNAAERAGRRTNSKLAREVLVLLPTELTASQRTELALKFSRQLADRYQNAVDLAAHEPRPGSDQRAHHAHVLMTVREVTPVGLARRTSLELMGRDRYARGLGPHQQEFPRIRATPDSSGAKVCAKRGERYTPPVGDPLRCRSPPDLVNIARTFTGIANGAGRKPSLAPSRRVQRLRP